MADYNQALYLNRGDTYAQLSRGRLITWLTRNYTTYASSGVGGLPVTLAMMENARVPTGDAYDGRKAECDSAYGDGNAYYSDCMSYGRETAAAEEDHDKREAAYEEEQAQVAAEEAQAQANEQEEYARSEAYNEQQQVQENENNAQSEAENSGGGETESAPESAPEPAPEPESGGE
jgi:hypothetical protein